MTARAHYIRLALTCSVVGAAGAAIWASAGCSAPDANARTDASQPSRPMFAYVAPVLVRRCGSIDCHGSRYRNLRIYGYGGQRLEGGVTPETPAGVTEAEVDATYASIVGLEPEIIADVVKSGGVGAERLTFLRKGRGDEDHKGDQRIVPHDDSDDCITSWLASKVDVAKCLRAGCVVNKPLNPRALPDSGIDPDAGNTIVSCP